MTGNDIIRLICEIAGITTGYAVTRLCFHPESWEGALGIKKKIHAKSGPTEYQPVIIPGVFFAILTIVVTGLFILDVINVAEKIAGR